MLGKGATNIAQIAKAAGVQRQTVYRLKADPAAAEAALMAWGL
jgi:putative DNA-invertase from lambdoid prophage Rac